MDLHKHSPVLRDFHPGCLKNNLGEIPLILGWNVSKRQTIEFRIKHVSRCNFNVPCVHMDGFGKF